MIRLDVTCERAHKREFGKNLAAEPARISLLAGLARRVTLSTKKKGVLEIIASLWRENPSRVLKTELFVRTV